MNYMSEKVTFAEYLEIMENPNNWDESIMKSAIIGRPLTQEQKKAADEERTAYIAKFHGKLIDKPIGKFTINGVPITR